MSAGDNKRYYWLRLKKDFFHSKRIKKLRSIAGGDTYLIIYLKLQLLALDRGGTLTFDNVEESVEQELALDIDEKVDDVRVTLSFLIKYGLCETSDNINFFLPYCAENTGSETGAAQRMREKKQREKLGKNRENFSLKLEIEKELEKEKELNIDDIEKKILNQENLKLTNKDNNSNNNIKNKEKKTNAMQAYNENIGLLTPILGEELKMLIEEFGEMKVLEAIRITAQQGVHSFNYVKKVCENYGTPKQEQKELSNLEKVRIEMQKLREEKEKWK